MIIDGKQIADGIKEKVRKEVALLKERGVYPSLSVIMAGNDPASEIYVGNKQKACEKAGIISNTYKLPENVSTEAVIELVEALNADKNVHGILIQLPLPKGVDEKKAIAAVTPEKDVDGFSVLSSGCLYLNKKEGFVPCTAGGIIDLIKSTGESIEGKNAVVIGRSDIVGKPVAMLLLRENATVTICHSRTKNIKDFAKNADILVAAVGKKHFVSADMIKEGAIVIDVGINRENGKLFGDVDFDEASKKAAYITPVPGGVGPMTIAKLLENTLKAATE